MKNNIILLFAFFFLHLSFAQPLELVWSQHVPNEAWTLTSSMTMDADENIYVLGLFQDTIDIDPGSDSLIFRSSGMFDIFIQKMDPDGNFLWAKQIGGPADDSGLSIAVDEDEQVYITGSFDDSIDVDPGPDKHVFHTNGERNTFILQLDPDGNLGWAKHLRGLNGPQWENQNFGHTLYLDHQGNLLVSIRLRGLADLISEGDTLPFQSNGWDMLLLKLKQNGQLLWHKQLGGPGSASITGRKIRSDVEGNIYFTGSFSHSVDVDPGPSTFVLTSNGQWDIFTLKMDSTGQLIWATSQGSVEDDIGQDLYLDHEGNIFIGGQIDFHYNHPSDPPFSTDKDLFLQKRDPQGNLLWENYIGGDYFDNLRALSVDSSGNLLVFAHFIEAADVDPGPDTLILTTQGYSDMFILSLSPDGALNWARSLGGPNGDYPRQLILTPSQELIVLGDFQETIDIDPGPDSMILSSSEESDYFIAKYKLEVPNGLLSPPTQASPFSVYPNPSSGSFELAGLDSPPLQILLYDVQGKLVKRLSPENEIHDIGNLPESMYLLLIQTRQGWLSNKLLLQK